MVAIGSAISFLSFIVQPNIFTVDDTRILHEQGIAMVPVGRSLLECAEMADHFRVYEYVVSHLNHPFDETLLKEVNRLVTEHTFVFEADSRGRNRRISRCRFLPCGDKQNE